MNNLTPSQIIASNKRQLAKISWKKKEGLEMAEAIAQFFDNNDIPLTREMPKSFDVPTGRKFLNKRGEWVPEMEAKDFTEFQELARMYFMLRGGNKSIVADFERDGEHSPMLMAHWYSRHRFCPVWNMRKSQLIRKKYREFLTMHEVDTPTGKNLLIREYTPVHMVLTLPHNGGYFEGQRFYARRLLHYFGEMRRTSFFKRWIYGGEYGLEIKKSKVGNGLHIHVHSLCFLKPGMSVNNFRAWLREKWERLTGATRCHFETLYYYKRDKNNQWEMEIVKKKDDESEDIELLYDGTPIGVNKIVRRKKHYISKDSDVDEYLNGVMECIKYHFKNDSIKDEFDEWDVPLIMDILNNSRNLRFYSRFGAFYNQTALNFNNLDVQPDEGDQQITGEEESVMGKASAVEENMINPFTCEKAPAGTYNICVVQPERLLFSGKNFGHKLLHYDTQDFAIVAPGFSLIDVIKAVCTNRMQDVVLGAAHGVMGKEREIIHQAA